MRIAMLAYRGSMRSGGLGIYIRGITRALVSSGHRVDLYVGPPYPDPMPWLDRTVWIHNDHYWDRRFTHSWAAPLSADGSPLRSLQPLRVFELAVTRFGFLPEPFAFSLRAARHVIAALRSGVRYDLIHDVQTLGYGLLWLRALGLPTVSTVHHPLTIDRRESLARDQSFTEKKGTLTFYPVRTQARVARRTCAILTSSEASVREIERGFGVPRERICNVSNGVELPARSELRDPPAAPELLFIGRTSDPNKGILDLIDALAQLPEPVRLRVIDAPWAEQPDRVRARVTARGLGARIRFESKLPRAKLEDALRSASAVVIPSLFEGFGLPAVEALASGTPIVASDAGALPEVVARAGAGRVVPSRQPDALARALEDTLARWKECHEQAVRARPRIEAAFSWPSVAKRTQEVYACVLRGRPASTTTSDQDGTQRAT